ncbi:MAG TPA: ATP-binding cassette domain-containing protein, partial [Rhizobium sp.]
MTQIDAAQSSPIGEAVLSVKNLTVSLPKAMERAHAVEDVSFDLMDGEILCIIGESGSGKSVTASAIMGLLPSIIRVTAGSIWFKGMDLVSADDVALRGLRGRAVSIIFQDPL